MIVPKPQSGCFVGELPFVRLGDGPRTLVIFPALGDAVRNVTDLAWRLAWYYRGFAGNYRIYLISRKRGLPVGYTTRQMAADYARAFEESVGGPVDVVGLSMGGLIAQHLAADFPQHVRRLIIGVAAHRLGAEGERMVRRWIALAQQERWRQIHADSVELMYTGIRRSLYGFLMRLISERLLLNPVNPSDYVVSMEACLGHDAANRLGDVRVPTLVVGGAQDDLFPEALLRRTAQLIPKSTLRLIEETGHGAFHERKRVFDEAVKEFIGSGSS